LHAATDCSMRRPALLAGSWHWLEHASAGKGVREQPARAAPAVQVKYTLPSAGHWAAVMVGTGQMATVELVFTVVHWAEQSAAGKAPSDTARQPLAALPAEQNKKGAVRWLQGGGAWGGERVGCQSMEEGGGVSRHKEWAAY